METYVVPTLEELGIELQSEVLWPGGESHALKRLQKHIESQVSFCTETMKYFETGTSQRPTS